VIVAFAGYPPRIALTVGVGLAQIGEFSFIIGTLGLTLGLLPDDGFQLIVAGALLSILINPFLFRAIAPLEGRLRKNPLLIRVMDRRAGDLALLEGGVRDTLTQHAVVCGYGRVGRLIGPALERRGFRYVVITQQREEIDRLRAQGVPAIFGDAANPSVLEMANIGSARLVVVATSDPNETRLIVERANELHPGVDFVVRTHSDTEAARLRGLSSKIQAIHGERELAVQMTRYALRRFGVSGTEAEAIAQGLRGRSVIGAPAAREVGEIRGWLNAIRSRLGLGGDGGAA
jgi:CPA2 family monovalent cation:H+ antiporter-2